MQIEAGFYKNKKGGGTYYVLKNAIDCTNARESTPVVIYVVSGDDGQLFVRETKEFLAKFEPLNYADRVLRGMKNAKGK